MRYLSCLIVSLLFSAAALCQSPHGKNFTVGCATCHDANSWKINSVPSKFNHDVTPFKLVGQHKTLACRQCHVSLVFSSARLECNGCHTDIHKNSVGVDCQRCHTPQSWIVNNPNKLHQATRFALVGNHAKAECKQCHSGYQNLDFVIQGIACNDCHAAQYAAAQNPDHRLAKFSQNCEECHSSASPAWRQAQFNHSFFPLELGHKIANCYSCHNRGSFTGLSKDCYSCHKATFANTKNPNHVTGGFPTACLNCHTTQGWSPANFDHNATKFALTGAHATTTCVSCHKNGYTNISTDCKSCHQDKATVSTTVNHTLGNFPQVCSNCHNTVAWKPSAFNHATTQFPLTGSHPAATCNACHKTQYQGTTTDCYTCHQAKMAVSTVVNHTLGNFSHTCQNCHSTTTWKPSSFNHSATQFPLTGKHVSVSCNTCHTVQYASTASDCYTCHKTDYANAKSPNHTAGGYPTTCNNCHTTQGWSPANFDHSSTGFLLTGVHVTTACVSCHKNGYPNTPTDCKTCHQDKITVSTVVNHALGNFPQVCSNCHTTTAWKPSSFSHAITQFPLTGSHVTATCNSCHKTQYLTTSTECKTCHQDKIAVSTVVNHALGNFPQVCSNCHTTTSWKPSGFNHSTTQYPLTGKHLTVSCNKCHTTQYTSTASDCYSCHITDYANAKSPDHTAGGYPKTCNNCHTTQGWSPANFDHATTGFLLTGSHLTTPCASCHKSGYPNTPTDCKTCHQDKITVSTVVNHALGNFPQVCSNCHTTTAWKPSSFSHATTQFPLTGSHQTVTCNSCHKTQYLTTATDCKACHQDKITVSTVVNHALGNFPQACSNCHTTTAWKPSSFSHATTQFPLDGKHASTNCNDCHTSAYATTPKDCYGCHQTAYEGSKNPSHTAGGYPKACADCHSKTAWVPASFDHSTKGFVLTGVHATTQCSACHTGGFPNTPTECKSCHLTNYQNSKNPAHVTLGLSQDCATCHKTIATGWKPADFPQHATYFAFQGAHIAIATNCATCHNGTYPNTPKVCYGCHQSNYTKTVNPPHVIINFSQDCVTCHSQTAWVPAPSYSHPTYNYKAKHSAKLCKDCHTVSTASYVPQCMTCHQKDFIKEHKTGHRTDCWASGCHPNVNAFGDSPGKALKQRIELQ